MNDNPEPKSLEQVLDRIAAAAPNQDRVSLREIVTPLGPRAFGPWLVLAGLITLSPVGDIPGTPTIMALLVLLISGQLLFHRSQFWLPSWMLKRSVARHKLETGVKWMRRPARFIDGVLRTRVTALTGNVGGYTIAGTCILIALAMPPMELVPFSATGAGIALVAFGLALIANDGLVALLAFGFTIVTIGAVAYSLL
ncbi:MAG: exopolysaccharide biosynthesis protein [Gammaproteobacteria bacterium]